MGWKGTVRSIAAASRAMERDAQRRQKQALKEQISSDAAVAVSDWENHIHELVSIHTSLCDVVDWHAIENHAPPVRPELGQKHQTKSNAALASFKPGMFDFLRGGSENRKQNLISDCATAAQRDQANFDLEMDTYDNAVKDWENDGGMARRLIAGEASAIKEVVEEMQALSDQGLIGSGVSFSISNNFLHARPKTHSNEIVPDFRRKQLASGKLSETKMPIGEFNELYQDHIASVALKVAGDLFNFVPLDEIYVTCLTRMLNSKTGHQEMSPILSVQFVRDTFFRLNLDSVDPSDSISNFKHTMSFKRTKGFVPIEPLKSLA